MTRKQLDRHVARRVSLLPNGIPKKVRIYDNGGLTLDCYTVVFTGHWKGKPSGWCQYVNMNGCPDHPQMGIYMRGESRDTIDYPRYSHLGKKIKFQALPPECQNAVLSDYKDNWRLE